LAVWLVRLWVLILDAIPIGFKVLLSLRSQRPYDALLAAHQAAEMDLARSMVTGQHRPITGPVPTVRVPVGATNGGGRHTGARYLAPSGTSLGRFAPPNAPDADN
jgi:hypothetical protein